MVARSLFCRSSYTAEVPYTQGGIDYVAEVTVYPAASGESPQIECVWLDGGDGTAMPEALTRLLEDKHLPGEVIEAAMEEAAGAESDAYEAAAEARGDAMRESERLGEERL